MAGHSPDASAFAVMAGLAAVVPGSRIEGRALTNLRRSGFLRFLRRAGLGVRHVREEAWPELVGRVEITHPGSLPRESITIEGQELMDMIDEVPLAAVVAATLPGKTIFRTGGVLRNKESDRLEAKADLVNALGGQAAVEGEDLIVEGHRGPIRGGCPPTGEDHRLVLAAAVAGVGSREGVDLPEASWGSVAFPGWTEAMGRVGVSIR